MQRVVYESLPVICFKYGRYGHNGDICLFKPREEVNTEVHPKESNGKGKTSQERVEEEKLGPWMMVERRQR